MSKKNLKIWLLLIVLTSELVVSENLFGKQPTKKANARTTCETYAVEELVQSGWNRAAVEAVHELNREFLNQVYESGTDSLEKECLAKWRRLGKPEFQNTLETEPALASLLASVLDVDAEGAWNIIQTIPPDEDRKIIVFGIYQLYAEPESAARAAVLLMDSEMRDYVIHLQKNSPLELGLLDQLDDLKELEDADADAGQIYRQWLCSVFDELLRAEPGSPEELNGLLNLDFFAERIRLQLQNEDETFRESFPVYWEQYQTILQEMLSGLDFTAENYAVEAEWVLDYYRQDPRVFEFLHHYRDLNAVQLYVLYGPAASVILLSPELLEPQNENARKKLVSLMLAENEDIRQNFTFAFLQGLAEQPGFISQFIKLLQKKVSDHAFYCMAAQLAEANSSLSEKSPYQLTDYWLGLKDEVLESEFSETNPGLAQWIPGYDIARLVIRMGNGQKVTGWDVMFAGVDAAFIGVDAAAIALSPFTGGGSIIVAKGTAAGVRSGLKFASKAILKNTIKIGAKAGGKGIARKLTPKIVKESAMDCMRVLKNTYSNFSKDCAKELVKGHVPITDLVRFSFSRSHLGRATYKKIIGLDARTFMRSDRRIFIDLKKIPKTTSGKIVKNLMNETAMACALGVALQTEPGQEIISGTVEKSRDAAKKSLEINQKWQKNLSLWWIVNQKQ